MDKIFTKYEKLFRDKTAFEKMMLGMVESESSLHNSKSEIEPYRVIPEINNAASNVGAVDQFGAALIKYPAKQATPL